MADKLVEEVRELRAENARLKAEVEVLKKQLIGDKESSWLQFKNLNPLARRSIVDKNKVKNGEKGVKQLMAAAKAGDMRMLEKVLEGGVPVDAVAPWEANETALMVAAKWGHTRCVEFLVANRCRLDMRDDHGETALYKAAEWGRLDTVLMLIQKGANMDKTTRQAKESPLMIAAKLGHTEIAAALVREGASLKVLNTNGLDAIECAREAGQDATVKALLQAKDRRRKSKKIDPTAL
mmetsp:Transcript_19680/g.35015  ORF Transcript_19680/g.35015 Transcript_19680/m.35015 type:complete len:237 (-) Transcript_19680:83-793(-)|eukprot:CAMPEP_0184512290 /NCGR_PEP_ID=MMETSP0198_2-20121128/2797_1 /TAXON_ID=1112570 /ORGANISM="Thraustochytrium sp., Strain LLF1b" /LENGTH=236 /DNA_ID=CAMNT_0026902295 /DNA_START=199 /DNA_END=909 /DNA_ORIENTATION=+